MIEVDLVAPATAVVGEGPHWCAATGELLWVDITAGAVHRTSPADGATTSVTVPTWVGAAVPHEDGLVLATREGVATLHGDRYVPRLALLPDGERSNDAKCDAAGRLWCGTNAVDFERGRGRLRVVEPDWSHRVVLDGLTLPNGLGWSPDSSTFYLVDSYAHVLRSYAFDVAAGTLSDERVLHEFDGDGLPDGLCVDTDGGLWVAIWGGGEVQHLDATGRVLGRVAMPVAQPSSCAFGGPGLDELFVTSARDGLQLGADAIDGSLFRISGVGVTGVPVPGFGA